MLLRTYQWLTSLLVIAKLRVNLICVKKYSKYEFADNIGTKLHFLFCNYLLISTVVVLKSTGSVPDLPSCMVCQCPNYNFHCNTMRETCERKIPHLIFPSASWTMPHKPMPQHVPSKTAPAPPQAQPPRHGCSVITSLLIIGSGTSQWANQIIPFLNGIKTVPSIWGLNFEYIQQFKPMDRPCAVYFWLDFRIAFRSYWGN